VNLLGSVRLRITLATTAIFAVFMVGAGFGLVRKIESAMINDVQVRNQTVTHALTDMLSTGQVSPVELQSSARRFELAMQASSNPELVREGITNSYIYATGPATNTSQSFLDRLRVGLSDEETPLFGKVMPSNLTQDRFAISRVAVQTPSGQLVLNVASPLQGIHDTISRITNALLVIIPALVTLVGVTTWLMTGWAFRPVTAITRRANAIGLSNLHERVPEPASDDEIGELARTMNGMLARMERSREQQQRFMSDASHELRSPVASIKVQLETALLDEAGTDWPAVARTVLQENERLAGLVTDLRASSRLEEERRQSHVEVDLDEVVLEQTRRTFDVELDRSKLGAGRIMGVSDELASLVRNLIDNAVRHAATRVAVSLRTAGPFVRLTVDDDGPGIAPADRQKVFERFARLEDGRTRDAGGSGLGLALAKRIVEAHDGRIFVETAALGGASFVVEFPRLDDDTDDDTGGDDETDAGNDSQIHGAAVHGAGIDGAGVDGANGAGNAEVPAREGAPSIN
jgi:signal transduction histidine kinase